MVSRQGDGGEISPYGRGVMRLVVALLAVLGLLAAPVAAAAGQGACARHGGWAAEMSAMPGMNAPAVHKAGGDPCCDRSGRPDKKAAAGCAQACAATCGVVVALAASPLGVTVARARADAPLAPGASSHPYQPPGLDPPPKPIV